MRKKENGRLLSKQLEINVNSMCNAMHFNVMDTMSSSGVAHEVQTISLGDKNCCLDVSTQSKGVM